VRTLNVRNQLTEFYEFVIQEERRKLTMAAALAQVWNALQAIGIVDVEQHDAITDLITSMDVFKIATDDFIKDMCKNICRPGGTLPNPNAEEPGAPAVIPCNGVAISPTAEEHLVLLAHYIRHLKRTSRPYPVQFNPARIYSMIEIKKREKEDKELAKDLTAPTQIEDSKKIRDAFENIAEYLLQIWGTTGVPLAYVICEEEEVPEGPDNNYQDRFEEMIARSPHDEESYAADNAQVRTIIRSCTHGGPAWSWVSAYAWARNGCAAWFALHSHYLGPTNQLKIMTQAEGDLESKFYNGERRGFTFERFAEIHQQAHTDMEEFGEPLTEAAKVRKFLKRIQAPFLNSAVAIVCANPSLKNDFEATVNFLSEFVEEQNQAQLRNILSGRSGHGQGQGKGSGRGNKGCGGRGGNKGVFNKGSTSGMVDRYYTFDEYKTMNAEQKRHLHTLREEAGGKRRNASGVNSKDKDDKKKLKISHNDTNSLTSKSSTGRSMSQRNSWQLPKVSVVSIRPISIQSLESAIISHVELDSHADTCCVGRHAYIYFKKPLKQLMFLHFYLHLVKPGLYQLSLLHLFLIILTHMRHLF
jgi:ribosomal protein L15